MKLTDDDRKDLDEYAQSLRVAIDPDSVDKALARIDELEADNVALRTMMQTLIVDDGENIAKPGCRSCGFRWERRWGEGHEDDCAYAALMKRTAP